MQDRVQASAEDGTEKKYLTAEDILNANDLDVIEVDIPEWGGTVRFRVMPAKEAIEFTNLKDSPGAKNRAWVKIFQLCAIGADGKPLFSMDQMEKLCQKSTSVFLRLQEILLVHNGLREPKKAQEDAKNA